MSRAIKDHVPLKQVRLGLQQGRSVDLRDPAAASVHVPPKLRPLVWYESARV